MNNTSYINEHKTLRDNTIKYFIILSSFISSLFGLGDYTLSPAGDIQFRFENKSKELSPYGESLLKKSSISYSDYILGGLIGFKAKKEDYELNTLAYTVVRLKDKENDSLENEKTFYGDNLNGFLYLGEFNIKKNFEKSFVKIGRQSYKSTLVSKNYRITQNSYEGVSGGYKNQGFDIKGIYFNKIAASTLSNSVPFNHSYGFLGYGLGYDTEGFTDISKHIINKDLSTNGAAHISIKYGQKDKYISFENLFADNFFYTSSLNGAYNINNIYIKAGAVYQTSAGENYIEKYIESTQSGKKLEAEHYEMKIDYKKEKFRITYNLEYTPSKNSSIYKGTLYSPFSNGVSWIVGMNTNHALIADTVSQGITLNDLFYVKNIPLSVVTSYIKYKIGADNGLSPSPMNTTESILHAKAFFSKNLSTKVQYSYVKNLDPMVERSKNIRAVMEYRF